VPVTNVQIRARIRGARCSHIYGEDCGSLAGARCGRTTRRHGAKLCSSHDPDVKRRERATMARTRIIRKIEELYEWWDGPGSEGRVVG